MIKFFDPVFFFSIIFGRSHVCEREQRTPTKDDVMVSRDRCFCDVSKLTTRRKLESNPNFPKLNMEVCR